MTRSTRAVDVVLPDDLIAMLDEVAYEPVVVRSGAITSWVVSGVAVAATAISLLQGPPAVAYWADVVKRWLKRGRQQGVGEVAVQGPGGTAKFVIREDSDLTELAARMHMFLFPNRSVSAQDPDDIAV